MLRHPMGVVDDLQNDHTILKESGVWLSVRRTDLAKIIRADRAAVIAEAKRVVETSVNLCAQPAVLRELKDHILAALDDILKEQP